MRGKVLVDLRNVYDRAGGGGSRAYLFRRWTGRLELALSCGRRLAHRQDNRQHAQGDHRNHGSGRHVPSRCDQRAAAQRRASSPPKIAVAIVAPSARPVIRPSPRKLFGGCDRADCADCPGECCEDHRAEERSFCGSARHQRRTWSIGRTALADAQARASTGRAADPVGPPADERSDQNHRDRGDGRQPQGCSLAERSGRSQECRHVGDADIISDRSERRDRRMPRAIPAR